MDAPIACVRLFCPGVASLVCDALEPGALVDESLGADVWLGLAALVEALLEIGIPLFNGMAFPDEHLVKGPVETPISLLPLQQVQSVGSSVGLMSPLLIFPSIRS